MQSFKGIEFKGTFRIYQQRVLDVADKHLKDGRIHIVAAPGSGKTILGCELIRRLNKPCLIFSPTVTIREQWGARFNSWFLNSEYEYNELVSYDLFDIKLINSVTYQALYSAMENIAISDDEESFDYSEIDLFKIIKEKKIKTICLDEAHHLKNEWQKALEKLINGLDKSIKIISLTATPPYDSSEAEWQRYINTCGEIDEEIFVPELVKQNTLCPHQDFVYLSYPKADETEEYIKHKEIANKAIDEIIKIERFESIYDNLNENYEHYFKNLYNHEKELTSLFVLFKYCGIKINKKTLKVLTSRDALPDFSLLHADVAIEFLLNADFVANRIKKQIKDILKTYGLIDKNQVCIDLSNKVKKSLLASMGKLESISRIVKLENESLKENLRMLILTDFIRQDSIKNINTDKPFKSISIVSIFEVLRRENKDLRLGALSGAVVILPTDLIDVFKKELNLTSKDFSTKEISGTNYSFYNFKGGNKNKVKFVSAIFEKGYINVLVGTKSLLGEGWDSPCINSLILASFIGSFVLSNQMRGRAIRIYNQDPNKCSNIWHLVTVEPESENNTKDLKSYDYDTLSRRFECFVGPNYDTGKIENGIDRITTIKPPYNEENISDINKNTEVFAMDREKTKKQWLGDLAIAGELCVETEIPYSKRLPSFNFIGIILMSIMIILESFLWKYVLSVDIKFFKFVLIGIASFLSIYVIYYFVLTLMKMLRHISPKASIKTVSICLLKSLIDLNIISDNCKLRVIKYKENKTIGVSIMNASIHEQNIFNNAITELFSTSDNPRYILVYKNFGGVRDYRRSFICPTELSVNKKHINTFINYLKQYLMSFEAIYIKNEASMHNLIKFRNNSYIFNSVNEITKKQKLLK